MKIEARKPSQGSAADITGKCPHCGREAVFARIGTVNIPDLHLDSKYWIAHRMCPNRQCNGYVLVIAEGINLVRTFPDSPKLPSRPEPHPSVPDIYRDGYREAASVLEASPKSSAALSRRILQQIIREHLKIKKKDLSQEIDEVIKTGIPTYLSEAIDAIRNVGNFAAHPIKHTNTGEIVDVESGEAEWSLDVLDMMFDFYFVQPQDAKARKDALNLKLKDLGKPQMK